MIYLDDFLWIIIGLFACIGFFRGAAKEMLVGVAVLLSLFFTTLLESSIPFIGKTLAEVANGEMLFYFRIAFLATLVFAGYQTPYRAKLPLKDRLSSRESVERMLGAFMGAINGFLIFGTFWFFLDQAHYPLPFIQEPRVEWERYPDIQKLLAMLPPNWLEPPTIYFAIAIGLAIVLIMFV